MEIGYHDIPLNKKKKEKMKYAEIKELSTEEIKDRIKEEKANLTKMKFGHAVSAIENPMQIRSLRKTIAQLNTELRTREINEAVNTPAV